MLSKRINFNSLNSICLQPDSNLLLRHQHLPRSEDIIDSMARDAAEQGVQVSRSNLDSLLDPLNEYNVTEEVTTEALGREVAGAEEQESAIDDESDDDEMYPSVRAQPQSLAVAKATLDRHGLLNECARKNQTDCTHTSRLTATN